MSGYKLAPVEPTAEMIEAAQDAYMPFGDMDIALRMALLAAPAVHGEPVAHTFYILHDATEGQKYIKKDVDDGCLAIFEREEDAQRAKRRHMGTEYKRVDYYTTPQPAPSAPTFQLGDHVRKTKGSQWKGRVVGTYSTSLTPEGYAVESDTEKGSVQIYPVGALELVVEDAESDVAGLVEALETCLEMEERPKIIKMARAALAAHRKQEST